MKENITLEEFRIKCQKKNCLRRTMITKNCDKEYKQESCFKKFNIHNEKIIAKQELQQIEKLRKREQDIKLENELRIKEWQEYMQKKEAGTLEPIEFEKDERYEAFKKECWLYYLGFYEGKSVYKNWKDYCMFWGCLTLEEKNELNITYNNELWINENLDSAHIEGKGENPSMKYNVDNIVIIGRLWHGLIDTYKDPITRKPITQEERIKWFERIRKGRNE
jgi:hypothetical protein